ncbi:MAG: hypothetical protein Q7W54_09665 [Bacteroidota bacterium]|nr:hypothetical protein [Bacteroidota bacterium]
MKKYFVLIAAVGMISMTSCAPAKKESKPAQVQQQNQLPQSNVQSDTSATISSVPETVPASSTPALNTAATPPELNPAHGQPFHRCDIVVGSPLNVAAPAKPAATAIRTGSAPTLENAARLNNPQANTTPTPTPSAPTVANASGTPPKLNPPHGQPFHKCEIPVGSPLN